MSASTQPPTDISWTQIATPPPPKRRLGLWIGVAAAAVVAAAGAALFLDSRNDAEPVAVAATSAAPSPTVDQTTTIECTNIERAYNAWSGPFLPTAEADVSQLNEVSVGMLMDDGKDFLTAVEGYDDQPSKRLAVKIAEYNFKLSLVNFQITASGKVGDEQAGEAFTALTEIHAEYTLFKAETCV
jgi:hypothetical protein